MERKKTLVITQKISILETDKTKTFLELSFKDKENQNLQKEVEKYKKKII